MKQTFKKLLAVIIAITMILGLTPGASIEVEAAKKFNCTIINLKSMKTDTIQYQIDLQLFIKNTQGSSASAAIKNYTIENKRKDFVNAWNSMSYTQHVVVIDTHGTPTGLFGSLSDEDVLLDTSTVKNLNFKKISYIVLLGCNCGHYDYKNNNIARVLADRFQCTVIACDGTVKATTTYASSPFTYSEIDKYGWLLPIADEAFASWCWLAKSKRNYYYGWLAYVPKNSSNNYKGKILQLSDCTDWCSLYDLLINYSRGSLWQIE